MASATALASGNYNADNDRYERLSKWLWSCLLMSILLSLSLLVQVTIANAQSDDWPDYNAEWIIQIKKDPNTNPPPHEPEDLEWLHLHRNHPFLPDALSNTIEPRIYRGYETMDPANSNIQLRYTVHSVVVSDWLSPPFRFDLSIDNPALAQLTDGIHDISVEVRGATRLDFQPARAFVHLSRDLSNGEPFGFSRSVPIINGPRNNEHDPLAFGPGVVYVDPSERNRAGYPIDGSVSPWSERPDQTTLYQELMAPHTELFEAVQLWWDHPAHADAPFVRGLPPKHDEDHRFLRVDGKHERFPMMDGPRGVGWMSPYISGQVDSQGRLAFAETGGRVGYLMPDGEILTIAGWRVKPGMDPIWWGKPLAAVRRNMENRGRWLAGRGEMFTPLDIAIDPQNENIWYVVGYEDHVVWKVQIPANPRTEQATISILAGDPQHSAGDADGNGGSARFNGPASIVFDPVNDVMYVADQDNDAIRQVTRSGDVTTLFTSQGMRERLTNQGIEWTDQLASRTVTRVEVTASQASQGIRPDIYMPQTIRVDSRGNIILLELGFGAIRRINPFSGETKILGEVQQKHQEFSRGWAWLDVDRYGNSGPVDGIYWCKFVTSLPDEIFNEAFLWLPPEGGESINLFPTATGLNPDGWGPREATNPPHYPWLVAVDPRGAVYLSGGGEHGLTRLRKRVDGDPGRSEDSYWFGRQIWKSGGTQDSAIATNSYALKYGAQGHNHLGLTSSWDLRGASDEQLLDAFGASDALRNDPLSRERWLEYVRPNTVVRTGQGSTPVISVTGGTVSEAAANARVSVSLSNTSSSVVQVSFATQAETATPGQDFYGVFRRLTFQPGETTKTIDIGIVDDTRQEQAETIALRIWNVSNATIAQATALITITDNDDGNQSGFSIAPIRVNEGDSGSITIERNGPNSNAASVHISTDMLSGGARAGADYYGFHEVVQFAAGESSQQVSLFTLQDTETESDEALGIRLFRAEGDVILTDRVQLTIVDDD